jgi:large subunit ribosomal protein L15
MQIHKIKSERNKNRKRVGRGGKKGTYSGKGMKGQKSRSGYSRRATWEGGRTTLIAGTKKNRGFKSRHNKMLVINLEILDKKFKDGEKITLESLQKNGIIKKISQPVKILSTGEITKKIIVGKNILLSKSAEKKIKAIKK